jgi:hypothetical protein
MAKMAAQHPTPHPEINTLLQELRAGAQTILGDQWVGMYLSGSLAAGDFDPRRSDIDFVVVTEDELVMEMVQALERMHTQMAASDSQWAKRLEGTYIPLQALRKYDTAKALYPSARVGGSFGIDQQGIDGIIQRSVLREQGIAIAGPAPRDLIDPVPPDDLRRASIGILHEWWQPQLQDQYRLLVREYQAYAVLTLCRILFTLQFGEVVSKRRAACWAQETLDRRWNALIGRASNWQPDDGVADLGETLELIRFTLNHTACEAP